MWLLAQAVNQLADEQIPPLDPAGMWALLFFELVASLLTVPYFVFFIWMLIHCYRTEPDRGFWIWVLIIAQPIGPVAYFVLRYLPSKEYPAGVLSSVAAGSRIGAAGNGCRTNW